MQPADVRLDEIDLSGPFLWAAPMEVREGAFATLRRERPIMFFEEPWIEGLPFPKGPGYWSLTKYADILEVSRSPERFCSGRGTNIIDMPPDFAEFFGSMISMDDPRHARLRRIVSRGFTPRMIQRVEAEVQRAAEQIVADIRDKGSVDFVMEVAAALPLKIICDMMGIPASDYRFVLDRSNIILGAGDPEYVDNPMEIVPALLQAGAELNQMVQELARFRVEKPTDDLTSALVNAEVDGERLTDQELGSFFVLLVVAGNETTRNAISHGLHTLTQFPEQKALWMSDFERYAPTAVEEIVRWATPVIHFRRTATCDTEVGGQKIREGEKVVLWYCSGNRDEAVFKEPFKFDIAREPNEHVGFGGPGPHFCLGAHLARREITVMFRELFKSLPDIHSVGEPAKLQSNFIHGVKHLQAEFEVG